MDSFRDHLIAATLKLRPVIVSRTVFCPFRDHLIAATLKREQLDRFDIVAFTIPRSPDRGHIEAHPAHFRTRIPSRHSAIT